jgi:hypothetical protein
MQGVLGNICQAGHVSVPIAVLVRGGVAVIIKQRTQDISSKVWRSQKQQHVHV